MPLYTCTDPCFFICVDCVAGLSCPLNIVTVTLKGSAYEVQKSMASTPHYHQALFPLNKSWNRSGDWVQGQPL